MQMGECNLTESEGISRMGPHGEATEVGHPGADPLG
jgi:hypothetical protein